MYSRWFNATVVVLWLVTMGWLVDEKVLPLLRVGEPPSLNQIIEAQREKPVVGWKVFWGEKPLGWALTETKLERSGLTEIHGRVHFDAVPLDEMLPGWLQPLSRIVASPTDNLQMDARSVLMVDPLGHLVRFDSVLRIEPWKEAVVVHGTVDRGQVQLDVRIRTGDVEQAVPARMIPLPANALLSDAFSPQPQTQLPGLRLGQTWTVPVYSPLWPEKNKVEILRATVESKEPLFWDGAIVNAWLVVYRGEGENSGSRKPRGKLWVRRDGAVIQEQASMLGSTVTFVRLSDKDAAEKANEAGKRWWSLDDPPPLGETPAPQEPTGRHGRKTGSP